ncbi:MAG: MarR family winged helix-turn-helix transcriptional regulator [Oscillospiraceae bacterium]
MSRTNNHFKGSSAVSSLNEASGLFAEYVGRKLDAVGMRASYRSVISPLIERDGVTQLELVNITGLKAPTISITLRNMERDGIVRREKNSIDRRETHVYITDKGREMYKLAVAAYEESEQAMLAGMTDKELKALVEIAGKMSANLMGALNAKVGK